MAEIEYLDLDWKRNLTGSEGVEVDGSGMREEIFGEMLRHLKIKEEQSEGQFWNREREKNLVGVLPV